MSLQHMLKPRLVELGAVRIGTLGEERTSRSGGTYRLPQKLDHFIVTTNVRDDHGLLKNDVGLLERLKSDYADTDGEVRAIPISLCPTASTTACDAHGSITRARSAWLGPMASNCGSTAT